MTDSKFSNFDYDLSVKILDLLKVGEAIEDIGGSVERICGRCH